MLRTKTCVMATWLRRLTVGMGALLAFSLFTVLYAHASRYYEPTSDTLSPMLEAREVLSGNPLLMHWYLGTVSNYTTDILAFTIALRFLPFDVSTHYNVAGLLYALTVVATAWLAARRGPVRRLDRIAVAAAIAIVAFPSPLLGSTVLRPSLHLTTIFWIILALIAIDGEPSIDERGNETSKTLPHPFAWWRFALAWLFLSLAQIADNMTLYIALGPIAGISLLRLRRSRQGWQQEAGLLAVCAGAAIAAKVSAALVIGMHGYIMPAKAYNNHSHVVAFEHLADNVRYTLQGVMALYNGDFSGHPLTRGTLLLLAGSLGLWVVLESLRRLLSDEWRAQREEKSSATSPSVDRIAAIAGLAMVVDVLCYALSNLVVTTQTTRYLAPFVFYSAILIGRFGVPRWKLMDSRDGRAFWAATFVIAGLSWFYVFTARAIRIHLPGPPRTFRLGKWLSDHGLRHGYGGYWTANSIRVSSHDAVQICPVWYPDRKFSRYRTELDERWYDARPANFLVLEDPPYAGIDANVARSVFGREARQYAVEGYTVLVWDKDIAPLLPGTK